MTKHYNIRISGRVQGVFFRASAKEAADKSGIGGFVRNEPDGTVYVEAEGEESDLQSFVEWCQRGPAGARVTQCEVTESSLSHFEGFAVRR